MYLEKSNGKFFMTVLCICCIRLTDHRSVWDYFDDDDDFVDGNFNDTLENCNCATFGLDWFNLIDLDNETKNELLQPFTLNSTLCCNSKQIQSLDHLTQAEWFQLEFASELFLRKVSNPYPLLDKLAILHLFNYDLNKEMNDSFVTVECQMERLYLYHSIVQVELLDQMAQSCFRLESIHLEHITPVAVPPPSSELFQKFNVLSKHFVSDHLAVVNLINCNIITLTGMDLLWNASNIRMISLSRNSLIMLENVRFFPSRAAQYWWSLDLSYNKLQTIPLDWVFPDTLRALKLDHNQFKMLPFDPFKSAWYNLDEFWIYANNFECHSLAHSDEWMTAISERMPLFGANWICYHSNATKKMFTQKLTFLMQNNASPEEFL